MYHNSSNQKDGKMFNYGKKEEKNINILLVLYLRAL